VQAFITSPAQTVNTLADYKNGKATYSKPGIYDSKIEIGSSVVKEIERFIIIFLIANKIYIYHITSSITRFRTRNLYKLDLIDTHIDPIE